MPAPKIRTEHDQLASIARSFERGAAESRRSFTKIRQSMDTLQGGDWIGKGASAFYKEMSDDVLPTFNRLISALEEAGRTTRNVSTIMKQAEEEAARLFRLDGRGGVQTDGSGGGSGTAAEPDAQAQAEQAKEKAKQIAAGAAKAMNRMAIALGGGAVLFGAIGIASVWTGIGAGAGAGGAAVCGLGAATAAWLGSNYQDVADDPPRDDYQTATKFEPLKLELDSPGTEVEATWQEFSRFAVTQSGAMRALVTSLERFDGLEAAAAKVKGEEGAADEFQQFRALQAEAVAHNAAASAEAVEGQFALRDQLNEAWRQLISDFAEAGEKAGELSPDDLEASYSQLWESNRQTLEQLQFSQQETAEMEKMLSESKQFASKLEALPKELLDQEWAAAVQPVAGQLYQLADRYKRLAGAQ